MGNVFGKRRSRTTSASEQLSNGHYYGTDVGSSNSKSNYDINTTKKLVSPLVYQTLSSMFVDEDGDVAHEFYYEIPADKSRNKRPVLVKTNPLLLKAQGLVDYDIPRLHPSFPYIMVEVALLPS